MSLQQKNDIEPLSERLGFLKIINKALSETNEKSDKEMSVAPAPATMNNNI